jgi:tetratricopeptide (TPR) repeat protein
MPRYTLILYLLLAGLQGVAQQETAPPPIYIVPDEYAEIHHTGEQALLQMKYGEALRQFRRVLRKFPDFPPALRSVGACHQMEGDFEEALKFYRKALEQNPWFSRALYYECGNMAYKTGQYDLAVEYFENFDSLKTLDILSFTYNGAAERQVEKEYYNKLPSSVRACHIAMDSIQFLNIAEVRNLGSGINTRADEYFPFFSNDGQSIFYTSRKNDFSDENLFSSTKSDGKWASGHFVPEFNTVENEGMSTLVRNGRRMFFTACQREGVEGPCDIWEAEVDSAGVFGAQSIGGFANSAAWESQASISCDGSVLFFASDREGGQGGTDIWMTTLEKGNRWGVPVNLGPEINTSGDEEAPFITNDGRVLYFSSTGHLGMGEQDIFMSRGNANGKWSPAVNIGPPVNTAYRELGFFLSADGKTGYFSSDRKGGYGRMDIYSFALPQELYAEDVTYVEGFVRDSITGVPVRTTIQFEDRPPVTTDEAGRFFLCVLAPEAVAGEIRAPGYHPYRKRFEVPVWDNRVFFEMELLLDPLFRLPVYNPELADKQTSPPATPYDGEVRHQVLFDFDKAALKPGMMDGINLFFEESLAGKTIRNVEVIGFADDIGADAYNLELSEKRAKAVGVFLKEKGITVNKIYIQGWGELDGGKPKWQNRKVELVVYY